MTTDGGSSPALDRLRAEINDKLSVAFFTAGHTSKVHQQIVLKQCEDYLVELFQTTVRELVPVPPALEITIVKLTDEQAVSALCILDGCQHMNAVPPAPSGADDVLRETLYALQGLRALCRGEMGECCDVERADAAIEKAEAALAAPTPSAPQPEKEPKP